MPIALLTHWGIFRQQGGTYVTNEIDMPTVRRVADSDWWDLPQVKDAPIVFDVETLPSRTWDRPKRDDVHDQMTDLVRAYRNHTRHQHKAIGFYAELPVRDIWRALKDSASGGQVGYDRWLAENRYFFASLHDATLAEERGLADYVDRIYPSLYYWYPNRLELFEPYARENLLQAAIYHKPIIAYVSPNVQQPGYPFWATGVWRDMLSYVWNHPLVDGVSIFGTSAGTWDENAPWWKETLEVLG
jgi:hypothetical protein